MPGRRTVAEGSTRTCLYWPRVGPVPALHREPEENTQMLRRHTRASARIDRTGRTGRTAGAFAIATLAGLVAAGCSDGSADGELPSTDVNAVRADGSDGGTPTDDDATDDPAPVTTDAGTTDATDPADVAIGIPTLGFSEGVVTAANPFAAEAGAEVLRNGGNAIDAAVTVQFVLNVVEPTSSGIGGGGFTGLYLPAEDRTVFVDSREKAPARATPTQYLACDPDCSGVEEPELIGPGFTDIATSGIGVGVPGTVLGAQHMLDQYGTITLAQALAPAIELAADGFEINERLASLTESSRTTFWPETRAKFRTPEGEPLEPGTLLVQPDLAKTFRLLAENGPAAFYTGEVAEAIVAAQLRARSTVGEAGAGRMALTDLSDYLAAGIDEREPVEFGYRDYQLKGMPFPSSGGYTVGQILACMEDFPVGDESMGFGFGSANTLNVMVESMRLAFSSRSVWMGDSDYVPLPEEGLLADGYLDPRCGQIAADARIDDDAVVPGDPRPFDPDFGGEAEDVDAGTEGPAGVDTTHFTVIDANGNVVTWTSTIEGTWGSGITVPGYGFLLNNELTDFNFVPQESSDPADFAPGANDVAPFKRPRSSMAPTLVFAPEAAGGDFLAAYGSPGGSTIINSVVNVTANLIDHGLSVQDAIDAPRISTSGGSVSYEAGFDASALEALTGLGHELSDEPSDEIGSVQAVVVDPVTGLQYGGADARRAGTVVGITSGR